MLTIGVQAAAKPIKLVLNGKSISTTTVGKNIMVNINDVASALGSKVVTSGSNRIIAVKLGNAELMRDTAIVYNGSDSAFREDMKLTVPVKYDNRVYVPIDFLQKTGLTPINYMDNNKKIVLGVTGAKADLSAKVGYYNQLYMSDFGGKTINSDYLNIETGNYDHDGYQTRDKDELYSIWGDNTHKWSGIITDIDILYDFRTKGVISTITGLDNKYKTLEFDLLVQPTVTGSHDICIIGNETKDVLKTITVSDTSKVIEHVKVDVTGQRNIVIAYSNKNADIKGIGKNGKVAIGDPIAY
jgi:hypothetical protein